MKTVMAASAVGLFGFSWRLPRFQFVVTALTAVYRLAVGVLPVRVVGTTTVPGMTLRAGPLGGGNDYPRVMILVLSVLPQSSSCHHPRVIQVRCNSTFLPAINSDKTHDLVIQWPTK